MLADAVYLLYFHTFATYFIPLGCEYERIRYMARGTTSYYGRRYTIATPMSHLYMLCACIFCWIVGYVDSVGYPVYGEVTAPPLWNALCLVLPGKLFTYLIGFLLMAGGAFLVQTKINEAREQVEDAKMHVSRLLEKLKTIHE